MGNFIDLTGNRFGRLFVIRRSENKYRGKSSIVFWLCKCDCGNETIISGVELRRGDTSSCGCYKKDHISEIHTINIVGEKYGRLTVVERAEDKVFPNGESKPRWLCLCDCGKESIVLGNSLRSGNTVSCGCYKNEVVSELKLIDLSGKRFGKLGVVERAKNNNGSEIKPAKWVCLCDCGNSTIVNGSSLKRGATISCGCLSESIISHEVKIYFINNYEAKKEYKILKNPDTGSWLRYDVYIPSGLDVRINGFYIEVHGKQHYGLDYFHIRQSEEKRTSPEKEFEYQKYKDELKKKFAKKNGTYIEVDLRKIKTTEQAIEYILNIVERL